MRMGGVFLLGEMPSAAGPPANFTSQAATEDSKELAAF